ncbi:Trafficking protein particle complex II-specific subunit 65 [Candida viswanathii]|uniref:Trafficking protein particle complex II-specific subunit 65 n=1 Tax=Candida viswanathii TaxID=5486 RepID=A0A367Y6X3_9ASCO|nr:Trafficking protein particle complex II-specific subunit 65 [Candida viswanathii]
MSLRIVLPLRPIDADKGDILEILSNIQPHDVRNIVFFDEHITGYVIFEGSLDQHQDFVRLDVAILPLDILEEADPLSYASAESKIQVVLGQESVVHTSDSAHIWKFEIPVSYPRKRLNNPQLYVGCALIDAKGETQVTEEETQEVVEPMEETLPNYFPCMKRNLLSELNHQLDYIEVPATTTDESLLTVQEKFISEKTVVLSSISVPVTISLVIKLKSTKPAGRNNMLLATLNIECSEELAKEKNVENFYFDILDLKVGFKSGSVQPISLLIPTRIDHSDSLNLAYKFTNYEVDSKDSNSSKPIHISLTLQVQEKIDDELLNISNIIQTEWSPYLDFGLIAPPINNALKTSHTNSLSHVQTQGSALPITSTRQKAIMNNIYKLKTASMSSANNVSNGGSSVRRMKQPLVHPSGRSSSVTVNLTSANNSSLSGLKLTFIGKLDIKLGEVVHWKIQAINNSPNRLNLSLLVQNPINFNPVYSGSNTTTNNFSSSNLLHNVGRVNSRGDVIIYNKLQLYALYNSLKVDGEGGEGVLILNNDIRIGPLDPNTVFETDIQLVGISKGIFNLDGVKVFDINSGDGIDFGKLVEVFVV